MKKLTLFLFFLPALVSHAQDWRNPGRVLKQIGRSIPHPSAAQLYIPVPGTLHFTFGGHPNSRIRKGDFRESRSTPDKKSNTTRFDIAHDLQIDVKGELLQGFRPKWKYIGDYATLNFQVEKFVDQTASSPNIALHISIGQFNGRPALLFESSPNCVCVADIVITRPPAVLTAKEQIFRLINFRKYNADGGKSEPCIGADRRSNVGGFAGELGLSTDKSGSISMNLMIENYSAPASAEIKGAVAYRYTAEDVRMPMEVEAINASNTSAAMVMGTDWSASSTNADRPTPNAADDVRKAMGNQQDNLICLIDVNASPAVINDSLMRFMSRRFPGKPCNSCLTRTLGNQRMIESTETYDESGDIVAVKDEPFTKATITLQNHCNKNLRVMGFTTGRVINGMREYGLVWKMYEANFKASFSRASNDLIGSTIGNIFSSMVFGGGEMSDIDLSRIGKPFDLDASGEAQFLRIIDEGNAAKTAGMHGGGKVLEVSSYSKATNIVLKKGDKLYLAASGRVATGAFSGSAGPEGQEYTPLWNIDPTLNYGALLVRVGTGPWQAVGRGMVLTAAVAGKVSLVVNDTDPSDNHGSFTVVYSVNKPLATAQ